MVDVDKEDRSSELEKKEQVTVVGPEAPSLEDSPPEESSQEYVPDGGREAWTVVLGTSLALFSSAGMINAYEIPEKKIQLNLLIPPALTIPPVQTCLG